MYKIGLICDNLSGMVYDGTHWPCTHHNNNINYITLVIFVTEAIFFLYYFCTAIISSVSDI